MSAAAAIVVGVPIIGLLKACAPSAPIIYARVDSEKAIVPVSSLGDLSAPGSFARVYVFGHANPIIVFERDGGKLEAILSTCSHSGCEVKKLRSKFECPCHGSEYDLQGNVTRGPAPDPLQSFRVMKSGEHIEILLKG